MGDRSLQLLPLRLINIIKIPTRVFIPCLSSCFYSNFSLFYASGPTFFQCWIALLSLCFSPPLHCTLIPTHTDLPFPNSGLDCRQRWRKEAEFSNMGSIPATTAAKAVMGSPNVLVWEGQCGEGDFASMLGLNES